MILNRTIACLFEVISDIDVAHTVAILQGNGVYVSNLLQQCIEPTPYYKVELKNILIGLDTDGRAKVCSDVISLSKTIRTLTDPDYKFDERWTRFERSLRLDGYRITGA